MKKQLALSALMTVIVVAASPAMAQLLDNPGFEDPITSNGAPFDDNWEAFSGNAAATAANSTTEPRTGAQHLALSILNTNDTFAGVFQDVPGMVAGNTVSFSLWHKTISDPLDLTPEVRIEWKTGVDGATEISRTDNFIPTLTSDYAPYSISGVVPAGASIARVVYAIQTFTGGPTNNGVIYIDDAAVSVIPEPASAGLIGFGALGLLAMARRKRDA